MNINFGDGRAVHQCSSSVTDHQNKLGVKKKKRDFKI